MTGKFYTHDPHPCWGDALDSDCCYDIEIIKQTMKMEGTVWAVIERAKIEPTTHHFYCREFDAVGESYPGACGKHCEGYKPRNGVSGRCQHHANTYDMTGEKYTVINTGDRFIFKPHNP